MAFWSDEKLHEPLRQHRWYISFGPNSGLNDHVFALKTCTKPSYKLEMSQHVLINQTFNFPKNVVWQPVEVTMVATRDDKGISASKVFGNIMKASGYVLPTLGQQQIGKSRTTNKVGSIQIIQLDTNGNEIENWCLCNPIIHDVNFGNLSYESEQLVEIKFTITYDYADFDTIKNTTADSELWQAPSLPSIPSETGADDPANIESLATEQPQSGDRRDISIVPAGEK